MRALTFSLFLFPAVVFAQDMASNAIRSKALVKSHQQFVVAAPQGMDIVDDASFIMVFDDANKNVMSTNGDRLTGPDIHELPTGTYTVFRLDLNGEFLAQEKLVIERP